MSSVFTARAPATRGGDTSPPHYLWFQFAFYDERRPLCGYSSRLRSTENVVINQHYQTKTNSINHIYSSILLVRTPATSSDCLRKVHIKIHL